MRGPFQLTNSVTFVFFMFVAGYQDACHSRGSVRTLLAPAADLQRSTVHLPRNQSVRSM